MPQCKYEKPVCMNIIPYLEITCLHCNTKNNLYEFHDSAIIPCRINGVEHGGKIILTCPGCKKRMQIISINFEKLT